MSQFFIIFTIKQFKYLLCFDSIYIYNENTPIAYEHILSHDKYYCSFVGFSFWLYKTSMNVRRIPIWNFVKSHKLASSKEYWQDWYITTHDCLSYQENGWHEWVLSYCTQPYSMYIGVVHIFTWKCGIFVLIEVVEEIDFLRKIIDGVSTGSCGKIEKNAFPRKILDFVVF